MNILCPNCQRPLTVQEQYAGQLMKCPLCGGTFTVPALAPMPAAPVSPPASAPPPPSPFAETWPPPSTPAPPPSPMETYGLSTPPAAERPKAAEPPPPEPPSRHEPRPWEMREPEPASEGLEVMSPPPPTPPEGYTHKFSLSINPRILPWIAPGAFVLIFFLTFFNWVGMYPGGYGVYTQNGWQAAFGTYSEDNVWEAKVLKNDTTGTDKPAFGVLPFFYLLVLLPTVFIAVASVLVHLKLIPINLPPVAQQYWWLRPLAVAGIAGFAFFFLFLIIAVGFPVESKVHEGAEKAANEFLKNPQTPEEHYAWKLQAAKIASSYNPRRTFAFRLVVILHLLALAGLGLEFWMDRRGNRPTAGWDAVWCGRPPLRGAGLSPGGINPAAQSHTAASSPSRRNVKHLALPPALRNSSSSTAIGS